MSTNISVGQLDSIHYFPPFHGSEHIVGEQYFFLSTPSPQPITVNVFNSRENFITSLVIYNAAPQSFFVGTDNSSRVMTELDELGIALRNKGYIFKSSAPFYCNYRVYAFPQSGSITCKGTQAVGRRFRPGNMINSQTFSRRSSSVSLLAVEDAEVTISGLPDDLIISGVNIVNGEASFSLRRGETIVLTAFYNFFGPRNNIQGFLGSLIESTGDIVVNSGSYTGGNVPFPDARDIGFDQITPMSNAGNSFVVIRGNGDNVMENVLLVVDQDDTEVFVNGMSLGLYNAGQYLQIEEFFFSRNDNMYIECTKPVVIYQMLGGFVNLQTFGLNFVPSLNCLADTAVNNIPFYNTIGSFSYSGSIIIVARAGARVEKNGVVLPANLSSPVMGNPDYVAYKLPDDFATDHLSIVSDQEVQVGLIGANGAVGFAAYFSGFAIQPETNFLNLTADEGVCRDTLRSEGNYDAIEWYYNDSLVATNVDSLIAIGPGDYQLIGYYDGCTDVQDTSFVYRFPEPDTIYIYDSSCSAQDTGLFVFNDITAFDCDSVTIRRVDYLQSDTTFYQYTTCDINQSERDTVFEVNQGGCDSLIISNYTYVGLDSILITETICEGEVYGFEGSAFSATGTYCFTYPSIYACDSVRCLELEVVDEYFEALADTICSYEKYFFNGDSLDQSGNYLANYTNSEFCDSTITLSLTVLPEPRIELTPITPYCLGDSILVEIIHDEGDQITWDDGYAGSTRYFIDRSIHTINLSTENNCQYRISVDVPDPIEVLGILDSISDYNGFQISCFGERDGWIEVMATGSDESYSFEWFDLSNDNYIGELGAGSYQVVVSDENNCDDTLFIELNEPSPIDFELETVNIDCQQDFGEIRISNVNGSVPEYSYFINGEPADSNTIGLDPGAYEVRVVDENLCSETKSTEILISEDSLYLNITGPDSVRLGDIAEFRFQSSEPLSEWKWYSIGGLDSCFTCLTYEVLPLLSDVIVLEGTDNRGCWSKAYFPFVLYYPEAVYIPNAFSPNGDGFNDMFIVHANPAVEVVRSYKIFDRWGELVFENYNLEPNVPVGYWTGMFLGKLMNPAVFVYVVEVEYIDGTRRVLSGDVTLLN